MTLYQILGLIGVPSLIAGLWGYIYMKIKVLSSELKALKLGTQAVLRNALIDIYDNYYETGNAPTYIKDDFENLYKQYHALGANGVMDSYYKQFMDLPSIHNGGETNE